MEPQDDKPDTQMDNQEWTRVIKHGLELAKKQIKLQATDIRKSYPSTAQMKPTTTRERPRHTRTKAPRQKTQVNLHKEAIPTQEKKTRKRQITIVPRKSKMPVRSKDIRDMFTQKDKRNEHRKLEAERIPLDKTNG